MNRNLLSKFKSFWTIVVGLILLQAIAPTSSNATLLATGERDSDSYRLGYAISSIMTLRSQQQTVYFEVIPSNEDNAGVELLQNRVSDFALIDAESAAAVYAGEDGAEAIRGLAVVRRPQKQILLLLTRADVAEQDVFEVTRAIFDNLDTLVRLHEPAAGIEAYAELDDHPFSIHPGAAAYFADVDRGQTATPSEPERSEDDVAMSSVIADLSEQLNLIKLERDALADEIEAGRARQLSVMKKLNDVEQELKVVIGERKRISDALAAAEEQLNTIEFQELFEANEAARAMRLRAEQSEARYQKAVGVAQNCVDAQSGRRDSAFAALAQIEQLEAEVAACRAAENSKGN